MPTGTHLDGAVWQAIDRLVEALRHTPEWEEWEQAKAAFDQDADVTTLRAQLQDLGVRWRRGRGGGRGLAGCEATEPVDLQETLRAHPLFVRQQSAGRQLVVLLRDTNGVMTSMLGIDFAANAAHREAGAAGRHRPGGNDASNGESYGRHTSFAISRGER